MPTGGSETHCSTSCLLHFIAADAIEQMALADACDIVERRDGRQNCKLQDLHIQIHDDRKKLGGLLTSKARELIAASLIM